MNATALAAHPAPTIRLLHDLFAGVPLYHVAFRLWDGTPWPDASPRAATIVLKHPGAVREMFGPGTEKGLAEAYLTDAFDVEGDLEAACELADVFVASVDGDWLTLAKRLLHVHARAPRVLHSRAWLGEGVLGAKKHSLERDRRAVSFHYDVSNDFFRLWLDSRMIYSCGYFEQKGADLETAQLAKLDYLCRKLRLQPRMKLLDIGCGWGGLAIHAARTCGVHVTGVTLSQQQAAQALAAVREAGLTDRVTVELKDYRALGLTEAFDAIVSVGMAEHVGAERLGGYFEQVFHLLKPGGVFLNHAIADGIRARPAHGPTFIQQYVFPDSDLPPLPFTLQAAESSGFEIRDVENLREHYRLTLQHWVRRLEAAHDAALAFVDESTYRIWRLYMAGSAHAFDRARLAIYQTLLAKPDESGRLQLPLTRRDWYQAG